MIDNLITINTERLTLRALTPEVYSELFTYTEKEIMEFLGLDSHDSFLKEHDRFQGGLRTHNKTFLYFQLIEKTSKRVIGWCGFHTWYLDHDRAELGYGLLSDEWKRKGYMSEALLPILDYGFNHMQLHRIEALASPQNTPSIKLLEANHFSYEGLLKEHYLIDGVYEDSAIYSLIQTTT